MLNQFSMKQTKDMYDYDDNIIAQANRYKLYMSGHAYIPYQDLGRYEKSFNLIYGK